MYCSACKCEFAGLEKKCPYCKSNLVDTPASHSMPSRPTDTDRSLIELVQRRGGRVEIPVVTTDVGHCRTFSFPYIGRGFGWEKKMQGCLEDFTLELEATEVAIERTWRLFYRGYGYAWARRMQGHIGGQPMTLVADEVRTVSKWMFPYFGFGYAWVQSMTGHCGDRLAASFRTTDVARKREAYFPGFGFGYAWADKGIVTLMLKETRRGAGDT